MKSIWLTLSCLVALAAVSTGWSADWPQYRGPKADGISKEKLANTDWNKKQPKLVWQVDMLDDSYSGPAVVGDKVYITFHAADIDIVKCLSLATGKTIWEYSYPMPGKYDYGSTRATPSISANKLVTLSRSGMVYCLDTKSGQKIWSRDIVKDFAGSTPNWGHSMSPLIDGTRVIVCPGGADASVAALDIKDGSTLWKGGGSDPASYSTPVKAQLQGIWQYVVLSANVVKGVDAKTGALLWQSDFKTSGGINIPQPIVLGNSVFITASYNMGCALVDVGADSKATQRWRNKAIQAHFSTPVLIKNYIYGIGDPNKLVCLDPIDGSIKWEQPGFEKGPVIGVDKYIMAMVGNTGELMLIDPNPQEYKEISRMPTLGGQSWTAPVSANGMLLVRNLKALGCYNMK